MNARNRDVPIEATYYREYGLHKTPVTDTPTYIASAPHWEEMEQLLRFNLPATGVVVTNDYATSSVDISDAPVDIDEVNERIRAVKYLSLRSDATIHLGTPHQARDGNVYLGAVSMNRGEVIGTTYKNMLYPVEMDGGLTRADNHNGDHVRDDGSAFAICSDLVGVESLFTEDEKRRAKKLFALTAWAYSDTKRYDNSAQMAAAGGKNNFYRERLETVVGKYVLPHLPHVNTVVVADEGLPDLAPYNAVFTRKHIDF